MIVYLGGYLYYKTNCNYMHINDKHILKKNMDNRYNIYYKCYLNYYINIY